MNDQKLKELFILYWRQHSHQKWYTNTHQRDINKNKNERKTYPKHTYEGKQMTEMLYQFERLHANHAQCTSLSWRWNLTRKKKRLLINRLRHSIVWRSIEEKRICVRKCIIKYGRSYYISGIISLIWFIILYMIHLRLL